MNADGRGFGLRIILINHKDTKSSKDIGLEFGTTNAR
jgi:hypothetical protein